MFSTISDIVITRLLLVLLIILIIICYYYRYVIVIVMIPIVLIPIIAVPRGGDRQGVGEPGSGAADREGEGRDHRAALPAVNCNRGGDQAGQTVLDLTSGK